MVNTSIIPVLILLSDELQQKGNGQDIKPIIFRSNSIKNAKYRTISVVKAHLLAYHGNKMVKFTEFLILPVYEQNEV